MTLPEYTDAVVAELVKRVGWTQQEAKNVAGSCDLYLAEGLTVAEAAENIVLDAMQASD